MSDEHDKLDELFRNRFEEVELPVSDKLLANIKQELDIPKRKRRFGFWMWFCTAVLVVAGIVGVLMNGFNEKSRKNQDEIAILETVQKVETDLVSNTETKEKDAVVADSERTDDSTKESLETTGGSMNSGSGNTTNSVEDKGSKAPVNASNTNENKKDKPEVVEAKVDKREETNKGKNKALNSEKIKSVKGFESGKSLAKTKGKESAVAEQSQSKAASNTSGTKDLEMVKNKDVQGQSLDAKSKQLAENLNSENAGGNKEQTKIAAVASDATTAMDDKQQPQKDSITSTTDTVQVVEVKKSADTLKSQSKEEPRKEDAQPKSFSFFVELNGGPSQSFRTFSPGSNYTEMQGQTEKPMFTYNVGIDAGILYKNKYQFTMGIGIDNKGERYQFEKRDAVFEISYDTNTVWDTLIYVDSTSGDTLMYIDSAQVVVENTEEIQTALAAKNGKNKYQYFRIPIMFGYRFNIGDKWFITPNVGVIANYLIYANSIWFDEGRQQYTTYNTRDKYRTLVIAGRAKLDIGFNVNEKWSILVQPGYTRFLQSIYRKEETFKHHPYSYDLNVAVRYTFQ